MPLISKINKHLKYLEESELQLGITEFGPKVYPVALGSLIKSSTFSEYEAFSLLFSTEHIDYGQ